MLADIMVRLIPGPFHFYYSIFQKHIQTHAPMQWIRLRRFSKLPLTIESLRSGRRWKGLITAFATERNWDDDLIPSTVKLRYATIFCSQDGAPCFWREMHNTILGLELSVLISLLIFVCKTIDFKT